MTNALMKETANGTRFRSSVKAATLASGFYLVTFAMVRALNQYIPNAESAANILFAVSVLETSVGIGISAALLFRKRRSVCYGTGLIASIAALPLLAYAPYFLVLNPLKVGTLDFPIQVCATLAFGVTGLALIIFSLWNRKADSSGVGS
jgi:hypothetical protein